MATLSELYERRDQLKASYKAIVESGQTYSIEGLSLTRADLPTIIEELNRVERDIQNKEDSQAGRRVGVALPKWNS